MKKPEEILSEIAQIHRMAKGKLCVMRRAKTGREYYSHQSWENGRNVVRYIPSGKAESLTEAIEGYQRFVRLAEEYVNSIVEQTEI